MTCAAVRQLPVPPSPDAPDEVTELVGSLQQAGASVHTMVAALNRAGTSAPSGLRWTVKSVRRLVYALAKRRPETGPTVIHLSPLATRASDAAPAYALNGDLVQPVSAYLAEALDRRAW